MHTNLIELIWSNNFFQKVLDFEASLFENWIKSIKKVFDDHGDLYNIEHFFQFIEKEKQHTM